MTNAVATDALRVAKALGWHPTAQPCQCWNCQAERSLKASAAEVERLERENTRLRDIIRTTAFHLRRGDHSIPRCVDQIIEAHEKALDGCAAEPGGSTSDRQLLQSCLGAMKESMRSGGLSDWTHMIGALENHIGAKKSEGSQ